MSFSIIAAIGKNGEIGRDGNLPWDLPEDLKKFRDLTENHTIIMGRRTFESILKKTGKLLPDRKIVVITRNRNYKAPEGCIVVNSLEEALQKTENDVETFIIGGAEIYAQALPFVEKMYITRVDGEFAADTFFPTINWTEWKIANEPVGHQKEGEPQLNFSYFIYERKKT